VQSRRFGQTVRNEAVEADFRYYGAMGLFDNLTDKDLEAIRRFIEETDVDVTNEDLRELVEKHWPWLLPKLSPPTRQ
jgi:hypothetical protein